MLEICVDGPASAEAAALGGADRIELCANLPEGGATPSVGAIRAARRAFPGRLMVIIRPRGYDFLYSEPETQAMLDDIAAAKSCGADGVVIGCLTAEGRVDKEKCGRLLSAADGMDVTFHRAFDMTRDLQEALEDLVSLGIPRVLTSGGAPDVPAGTEAIRALALKAAGRILIMPGGGVTELNLAEIVRSTGVREIHLSARDVVQSRMTFRNEDCSMGSFSKGHEYEWKQTSAEKVRLAKAALAAALPG